MVSNIHPDISMIVDLSLTPPQWQPTTVFLGRMGEIDDFSGDFHYLAADESSYYTGQIMQVRAIQANDLNFSRLHR